MTPLKTSILKHLHDAVDALVEPHAELSVEDAQDVDRAFCTLLRLGREVLDKSLADEVAGLPYKTHGEPK
jgi:hypothetical protein